METFLKWHNVLKAQKEKKELTVAWWVMTWERGLKPPMFPVWTDDNKAKPEELKSMEIDMSQIAVGRLKELKKRLSEICARKSVSK